MKIIRFQSVGLNGYLDFSLDFNPGQSFLIGINGSGKTSVLRAIVALLSPDTDWLVNTTYSLVAVDLDVHGDKLSVISQTVEGGRRLTIYRDGDILVESHLSNEGFRRIQREPMSYVYEDDSGEYVTVEETQPSIPPGIAAIDYIKRLPTPIYLGLDRSTLPLSVGRRKARRHLASRQPHATLRAFLDDSVAEAEAAAVAFMRQASVQRQNAAVELRKKILLTLFIPADERRSSSNLPKRKDIRQYEQYRRSLKSAFKTLGLDTNDVAAAIDPFFTKLISLANELQDVDDLSDVFKDHQEHLWRAFSVWTDLAPRLVLFEQAEKFVKEFNEKERVLFDKRYTYLSIMNSFFEDSKKVLDFDEDGSLVLYLPSGDRASVYYLSSGERQLFVLITTLMFVQDHNQANILIIDEPELSLHMKWQEMFVDSLMAANSDVQLILATHSPSIIVDNVDCCVDLA